MLQSGRLHDKSGSKGEHLGKFMKRTGRPRSTRKADSLPPDIGILLQEIENEPVPERLLDLARRLQEALVEQRRTEAAEEAVDESG